ncbi:hypothetical protein CALCODRAFT_339738 [Calocera cornea HHB12733]|uniref:C2H2-type domain-containing protein n=1 Tax=Calocera cornea HHB12733 TaxID=1353952 RepID=A0A165EYU8_9BASI|nr:hypothetical protein CALCODRAFT_339738 [Calocera cornea HHB12733]
MTAATPAPTPAPAADASPVGPDTPSSPRKTFDCDRCGSKYSRAEYLRRHARKRPSSLLAPSPTHPLTPPASRRERVPVQVPVPELHKGVRPERRPPAPPPAAAPRLAPPLGAQPHAVLLLSLRLADLADLAQLRPGPARPIPPRPPALLRRIDLLGMGRADGALHPSPARLSPGQPLPASGRALPLALPCARARARARAGRRAGQAPALAHLVARRARPAPGAAPALAPRRPALPALRRLLPHLPAVRALPALAVRRHPPAPAPPRRERERERERERAAGVRLPVRGRHGRGRGRAGRGQLEPRQPGERGGAQPEQRVCAHAARRARPVLRPVWARTCACGPAACAPGDWRDGRNGRNG